MLSSFERYHDEYVCGHALGGHWTKDIVCTGLPTLCLAEIFGFFSVYSQTKFGHCIASGFTLPSKNGPRWISWEFLSSPTMRPVGLSAPGALNRQEFQHLGVQRAGQGCCDHLIFLCSQSRSLVVCYFICSLLIIFLEKKG